MSGLSSNFNLLQIIQWVSKHFSVFKENVSGVFSNVNCAHLDKTNDILTTIETELY